MAGKAAENAARIAGVLTVIANPEASTIDADAMTAACELMTWYVGEALRLSGLHRLSPALRDSIRLLDWLHAKPKTEVTRRWRSCSSDRRPCERKRRRTLAMTVLEDHGHAVRTEGKVALWTLIVEAAE